MTENYYEILNSKEDDCFEDIKASYQMLVKQHHPDKLNGYRSEMYEQIDKAWTTLRHVNTRREYDSKLLSQKLETDNIIFSVLTPDELNWNAEDNSYTYSCRCGGVYCINVESINEDCTVHCDECSLVIVIKYNKDE